MRSKPGLFVSIFGKGTILPQRILLLAMCLSLLAACSPAESQVTLTDTAQPATATLKPKTSTSTLPAETSTPIATTPPAFTKAPALSQDDLKAEWRIPFKATYILFSSCELMYDTHVRFKRGEIDAALAAWELDLEANAMTPVTLDLFSWSDPSSAVQPFFTRLMNSHNDLADLWTQLKSGDMADPTATSPLDKTCLAFYNMQSEIYKAMKAAGLTTKSIDELGTEFEDILNYLYGSIRG